MNLFERYFENPFDRSDITDQHFLSFTKDSKSKFEVANISHQYDDILGVISPKIIVFENEIGIEDTSFNIRKGKTKSVISSTSNFGTIMSELEGVIAFKLGGKESEAYFEFYPNGLTEYSSVSRDNMALFTKRISMAAT